MGIITKELINKPSPFNFCLKCDAPIWEEFALGLEYCGGLARNNKFRGVRGLTCKKPQTDIFVDVPDNLMDKDLIKSYINYLNNK